MEILTSDLTIDVGETVDFNITYTPENSNWLSIGCYASNDNIYIDSRISNPHKYSVTGKKGGKSKITCYNSEGGSVYEVKKTINVNVIETQVSGVSFMNESTSLYVGRGICPAYTIYPSNATNKNVTLTSSNPSVVYVSNNCIHAASVGTAIITIATEDGNKKDTLIVNTKKVDVTDVDITNCPRYDSLKIGDKIKLNVVISPETATNKNIKWRVDVQGAANIDPNGNVEFIGAGKFFIYAISEDNGLQDYCMFIVGH